MQSLKVRLNLQLNNHEKKKQEKKKKKTYP